MTIIDMRCRPAYLHAFFGAEPGSSEDATAQWLNKRVGTLGDPAHYHRSRTREGFLDEVRDAGVSRAILVGRQIPGQRIENQTLFDIVDGVPELEAIGSVDPVNQDQPALLADIDHAIEHLGLKGINLEPGFHQPAWHADDARLFPIYEHCARKGIPVSLMSGPTTPDPRYNDPAPLALVAAEFPQLRIICYHGYYPNTQQAVGLAFRYPNIHLVPDMYLFQPGSNIYIEAANAFLSEQLLFGSSYPFRPIRQSVEDLLALGLRDDVVEQVLYRNAARLLGLTETGPTKPGAPA